MHPQLPQPDRPVLDVVVPVLDEAHVLERQIHYFVNGASGIAVGMATNLVPHNLGEVLNGARPLLQHPKATLADLMTFIPGPDFPGGGVIVGLDGVRDAYESGRGTFRVRARTRVEQITQSIAEEIDRQHDHQQC